jgi:hypothetical protein
MNPRTLIVPSCATALVLLAGGCESTTQTRSTSTAVESSRDTSGTSRYDQARTPERPRTASQTAPKPRV